MIDGELFREVMASFASGVTVVTTAGEGGFHGVTLSSFCSLSLDPPLVLVCIDKAIQSHDLIRAAEHFVVNILAREQTFVAEQFAGRTPLADPGFSRVPHSIGSFGVPVLSGTMGYAACRRWAAYDGGDHSVVVGEVLEGRRGPAVDPLIFFDRGFTELAWS